MAFTVEEFNPAAPVLIIDSREIELMLMTLKNEVIFIEKYGSVNGAIQKINEDATNIMKVIWILVKNKEQFSYSEEEFRKFCFSAKESTVSWSKKMADCFNELRAKSNPLIKNIQRLKDVQRMKEAATETEPCYSIYYDAMAKRYGLTIVDFYNLTLRQIHAQLKTIGDEAYKELALQAALAGRELEKRITYNDISEEQDKQNEDDAMDAFERLKADYKKNKDSSNGKQ